MSPLICLMVILGMGNCLEQLPTRQAIETSINRTIEEVERMVRDDPSLPRLTRDQIVDILFNITATDIRSYEKNVENTRQDYQRALMIVLPSNSNYTRVESLEELYAKAPLTKIIKEPFKYQEQASKGLDQALKHGDQSSKGLDQALKHGDQSSKGLDQALKHGDQTSKGLDQALKHGDQSSKGLDQALKHGDQSSKGLDQALKHGDQTSKGLDQALRRGDQSAKGLDQALKRGDQSSKDLDQALKHGDQSSKGLDQALKHGDQSSKGLDQALKHGDQSSKGLDQALKHGDQTSKGLGQASKDEDQSSNDLHYDNHRDTYADVEPGTSPQESLRIFLNKENKDLTPEKFSLTLENFGTSKNAQSYGRPIFSNVLTDRDPIKDNSNVEIVYSTSVTQRPTTKLVAILGDTEGGFRPTMPPVKSTENVLTSDQWRYNAPPSSTTGRPAVFTENPPQSTAVPFLPTMMAEKEPVTSTDESQGQKDQVASRGMEKLRVVDDQEKRAPLYVTPMSSTSLRQPGASSTAKNEPKTTKMPMREEVQDLLASIGLHPGDVKDSDLGTSNQVSDVHGKLFGTNFQIPESTNVIGGPTSGLTAVGDSSPSLSSQNTFERTPQEVRKGVDNLSPDVQLLFQRFGLQSSAKDPEFATKRTTEKRVQTTRTSFWNNFKPLPDSQVKDEGMRDFLAKFGLGMEDSRREKSMNAEPDRRPSLIEAVPADMKRILENIGLITKSKKAAEMSRIQTTETPHLHVFKPHETAIDDEQQRAKINELLDTVKLVQDGKADVTEVQKVAKELLETTKSLKNGPDPLSLEEILRIYNNDLKNEIKRQQDSKDLAGIAISEMGSTMEPEVETSSMRSLGVLEPSGASSDAATTSTNSTNESKDSGSLLVTLPIETANLETLEDSFGGSTSAPDTVLPTPRKTGLYFLVDWNTFLEVGEDGKDKVNLRFQPKVGDRTRFLPVTVP